MQEVTRNDVHIDVCPRCRGVWLDRGELEKLLGSVREVAVEYERKREAWGPHPEAQGRSYPSHHKKKKSFLEAFDIFD
jgi:Zn-finger nucleic acid-binding protein